jgi:hypothetical protein
VTTPEGGLCAQWTAGFSLAANTGFVQGCGTAKVTWGSGTELLRALDTRGHWSSQTSALIKAAGCIQHHTLGLVFLHFCHESRFHTRRESLLKVGSILAQRAHGGVL